MQKEIYIYIQKRKGTAKWLQYEIQTVIIIKCLISKYGKSIIYIASFELKQKRSNQQLEITLMNQWLFKSSIPKNHNNLCLKCCALYSLCRKKN